MAGGEAQEGLRLYQVLFPLGSHGAAASLRVGKRPFEMAGHWFGGSLLDVAPRALKFRAVQTETGVDGIRQCGSLCTVVLYINGDI